VEFKTLACGSTHWAVIRAAQEFPTKLFAVHGDKIQLRETAVYFGNGTTPSSKGKGIDVSCSECGHEWSPRASDLLQSKGCPSCAIKLRAEITTASAGKRRCPRPTPEEKQRAVELKATGMASAAVAQQLLDEGLSPQLRGGKTIDRWVNPEEAEKNRQRTAKWNEENREQKNANQRRYTKEFDHGRAGSRAKDAQRRLLKQNTPEFVFLDGEWHEVDRRETYRVFKDALISPDERAAIEATYIRCQKVTELSGIEHHVDHIQPLSKGGEHNAFNLQLLTADDNLSKKDTFREEDQAELCRRLFNIQ
jgi:predicted  nucleic acid-binding Zn-ribbon protein